MTGTMFDDFDKLDTYLHAETVRRMQTNKDLNYKQALLEMQRENPALMRLREALYMKRERSKCDAKTLEWVKGELKEVADDLGNLTKEAMRAHPELTYGSAFKLVAGEQPNLIRRYNEAYKRRSG